MLAGTLFYSNSLRMTPECLNLFVKCVVLRSEIFGNILILKFCLGIDVDIY